MWLPALEQQTNLSPLALSLRFLQTQSDAQLAALARAGHERAFEALVRRYRRPLLAYCRRVGSAGTNAEDTLQQALLQAWSAIRTGVEVRDPRAWLYRIVHNVAVSNQRRPVLIPVEMRDTVGANGADLEAEQRMAARDALAGLAALPDLQREVMVGTAVDGMSHEELASALGLSSGAVRGLIYRARATLRAAAAAITPGPVISWALRSGSGPGAGLYEALAGSGTAGIGGILVKGGAIAATAGAIATAAGISTSHKAVHHRATPAAAAARPHVVSRPASGASHRVLVVDPTSSHVGSGRGSAPHHPTSESSGRGSADGDDFAATSGGHQSGERHDGGDRGGGSGTGGQRSGHDGSHRGSGSGSS
ncbi:MAG: RNA polymerase sigma factor, partial [Solirubrobacteraceae bacterium]